MVQRNYIRSQIISERKRKNRYYVYFFILAILFIIYNLFFDDMGFVKYIYLKQEEQEIQLELAKLEKEIGGLKVDIKSISKDPFYIEKQARENFGLALPDEYIFKYEADK